MSAWYVFRNLLLSLSLLALTGCKVVDNSAKGSLGKGKPTPTPTPNQAPGGGGSGSSFVLGQPDTDTVLQRKFGMARPMSGCSGGGKMVVISQNQNRAFIYNTIPTANQAAPDIVLGQVNSSTAIAANYGGLSAKTLAGPSDCATDGTKLAIADGNNNRVLIWNTFPTTNFQPADLVLGQPDFVTNTVNNGGISETSMSWSYGIDMSGGKLFLTEYGNNRVLIWNTFPTVDRQPADVVLGQPDFNSNTANNGGISASRMNAPESIAVIAGKLFVVDDLNHRVLVWNSVPTVSNTPADFVLGQPDMTSNTVNNGGLSDKSFNQPFGVDSDGTNLIIGDYGNNRVLIWNPIPTATFASATYVMGQPDFISNTAHNGGISASSLSTPSMPFMAGAKIVVPAYDSRRILIWNSVPAANFVAANVVIGQPDFTTANANYYGPPSAQHLTGPGGAASDGTKFVVPDFNNHRILIWNSVPTTNLQAADVVLGQPGFTSNTANNGGVSAQSLWSPNSLTLSGGKLFVADYNNHRALIWNTIPTANQQAADVVLGQPDMTSNIANNGGISAQRMNLPQSTYVTGTKLFVIDGSNHRVLVWNTIPTVSNTPADFVLGQPDMTSNTANNGGISAQRMNLPTKMHSNGTKLVMSDFSNHRVLIWNTIPTATQQPADVVLGQPNMTSNTANNGGLSAQSLNSPDGVFIDGTRLYVSDRSNHRILIWNTIPTSDQQPADLVFGQPNMTSNLHNNGGVSFQRLWLPVGVFIQSGNMFISDFSNNRILVTPTP